MKQLIFIIATIPFLFSCSNKKVDETNPNNVSFASHPEKKKDAKLNYTKEQIDFLQKMGMVHSKTFGDNLNLVDQKLSEQYFNKFHLSFISDLYLAKLLKEKDLFIGDIADFKDIIPPGNIDEFKTNYNNALAMDSNLIGGYFIRVSRLASGLNQPGKFLQKINVDELYSAMVSLVVPGFGYTPHEQSNDVHPLINSKAIFYSKKYNLPISDIVVDYNIGSEIKIIAPKELFNLEGKVIENNEIKVKNPDPAIVLRVSGGWLNLTTWQ